MSRIVNVGELESKSCYLRFVLERAISMTVESLLRFFHWRYIDSDKGVHIGWDSPFEVLACKGTLLFAENYRLPYSFKLRVQRGTTFRD